MSCPRLDQLLCEQPSAEARAHASSCPECGPARAAWEAMNGPAASTASLEKVREAVRAELRAQPRARSWIADAAILLAINLGVAGLAFGVSRQPPAPAWGWAIAAALIALSSAGAWAAVRPGAPVLRLGVLGIAGLGACWAALGGANLGGAGPVEAGFGCALLELAVSVIPLLVALWIISRFAFDPARALVAGLSVGATAMLVLHLHCPNGATGHLFAFHLLPGLVVALGVVGLRRALPTRSYAP